MKFSEPNLGNHSVDDIIREHKEREKKNSLKVPSASFSKDTEDIINEILISQRKKKSNEILKRESELESIKKYEIFDKTMDIAVREEKQPHNKKASLLNLTSGFTENLDPGVYAKEKKELSSKAKSEEQQTKQIRGLKKDKITVSPPRAKIITKNKANKKPVEAIPKETNNLPVNNKPETDTSTRNKSTSNETGNIPVNKKHETEIIARNESFSGISVTNSGNTAKPVYDENFLMQYKAYRDGRDEKVKDFFDNDGENLKFTTDHDISQMQKENTSEFDPNEYDEDSFKENFENIKSANNNDEFLSDAGAVKIFSGLKRLHKNLSFRIIVLSTLFLISMMVTIFGITDITANSIFENIQFSEYSTQILILQLIILIIVLMFSYKMVLRGFKLFFTLKSGHESLSAITGCFCLIHLISLLVLNDNSGINILNIYTPVLICSFLFDSIGKIFVAKRALINFKFVGNTNFKRHSASLIENENIAASLTKGTISDVPVLAVNRKTSFLTDFMYHTYREDITDTALKIISPVIFTFSLAAGFIIWHNSANVISSIGTVLSILCFASPTGYMLSSALPQLRLAKKLHKKYCAVLGYEAIEDFTDVNACGIEGIKLFPNGTLVLEGIRTFSGKRIDDAILDAASVLKQAESILCDIFMQVIMKREDILKEVDTLLYEDSMGITAWVDDRRVLIGTRELMVNHDIRVPPKKFENKYMQNGHDLIYLANSGELTAVFIVSLHADEKVKEALIQMQENDIFLIVKSVDSIITKQKLAAVFGVEPALFKVLPSRLHEIYNEQTKEEKKISGAISNDGSFFSYVNAVIGSVRVKTGILIGFTLSLAFVFTALVLSSYYIFSGGVPLFSFIYIILYQIISVLFVIFTPRVKKL